MLYVYIPRKPHKLILTEKYIEVNSFKLVLNASASPLSGIYTVAVTKRLTVAP
jgi:hypothetical protein